MIFNFVYVCVSFNIKSNNFDNRISFLRNMVLIGISSMDKFMNDRILGNYIWRKLLEFYI